MEEPLNSGERRRYPRIVINLPLEYQDTGDPTLRGAMVVNAGEGGFLIESTRDMPVGTKLNITVMFSRGYELADFKAGTKIVRKEPYRRDNSQGSNSWEGYRYGLEFVEVAKEDRWKLNWLLGGRFEFEETFLSLFSQV